MTKASLLVIQGPDQGARFEIGDETVDIGRGVHNDVRLLDTEISRRHASIRYADDSYVITDLDSSNGTFVNGVAARSRELNGGDQIQMGRTIILFSEENLAGSSQLIADRIDLVSQHTTDDRSSIVGEISPEASRSILDRPTMTGAAALANLQALYRISEVAASPSLSLDQLLKRILDLTIEVVGGDRGCILLGDARAGRTTPQAVSFGRGTDQSARIPVSRSIVDYVLKRSQGVRTSDARRDRRFETGQSILQAGICEAMCVPIQGQHDVLGVIYIDTTTPPERAILEGQHAGKFDEEELRLLVAIGRQTALAIENHRYQQALLKAERLAAVGQTIAMLSHHIKNILQGVRGGSYLIDMGLKDHNEELLRRGWGIVEKNQNKIYHLVMDMLTYSKERKPAMQTAALNDTVLEVCELMQARADECHIVFERGLDPNLPPVTYDEEGIHRAVLNIVINAIDAVEGTEDGRVMVRTGFDEQTDNVFVTVLDNGPGIPEDQIGRIFNVFESTKGARGTGLGLAVSQKIVREHGGEITVESKPNQGCRFTLAWPRVDEEFRSLQGETLV